MADHTKSMEEIFRQIYDPDNQALQVTFRPGSILYPEVDTFGDLPAAAAANNGWIYVVKGGSGVWLINRKPAGLYISDGVSWTWMGAFPNMFSDSNWSIYNNADNTKEVGA